MCGELGSFWKESIVTCVTVVYLVIRADKDHGKIESLGRDFNEALELIIYLGK
jgi:hypothetical protein